MLFTQNAMASNYPPGAANDPDAPPPGAANDPDAPYNAPLDEDEEVALLQAIYYPKRDHRFNELNKTNCK